MRSLAVMAVAWLLVLAGVAGAGAAEASIKRFTNIDAQGLEPALKTLARERGFELVYRSEVVGNLTTLGVKGELTSGEALTQLLRGTNLTYRYLDEKTVTIVPMSAASTSSRGGDDMAGGASVKTPSDVSQVSDLRLVQSGSTSKVENAGNRNSVASGSEKASSEDDSSKGIQEIVVTAQKREERLQDVPYSIAVLTSEDIGRRGLVGAEDYLRGTPGINQVDADGSGGQAIIIRGLEVDPGYQNLGAGATVATYFGEAPTTLSAGLAGTGVDLKLVDIERVEMLRGPQGTAFGDSSMGGAVRTIPVAPRLDRYEGHVGAGYSSTGGFGGDNYMLQAVGNAPLIADKLAVRAVAYKFFDSGFYRNRAGSNSAFQTAVVSPYGAGQFALDEDGVGAQTVIGWRAAALFQATDNLRFTLTYVAQKNEIDGIAHANSGPFEQTAVQVAPEHVRRNSPGGGTYLHVDFVNAVMDYDFSWADLTATYSYMKGGMESWYNYTANNRPYPTSFHLDGSLKGLYVGEMRLATKFDGPWNFLAGIYTDRTDDDYGWEQGWAGDPALNTVDPPGTYSANQDKKQIAAFGQVSWQFAPGWTLTGGMRAYEYERAFANVNAGPLWGGFSLPPLVKVKASGELFSGNLKYKPTEASLIYASYGQGMRLGRPQAGISASRCDLDNDGIIDGSGIELSSTRHVDSDRVNSYELGTKLALMDRRLSVSAAVYRMDWEGLPVQVFPGTCTSSYLANAGAARSEGVELGTQFQVTDGFRVDLGGSYIRARLTEDVPAQRFLAGDRLPASPKFSGNLGLQQGFAILGYKAFVRADASYVGSFYGDILSTPTTLSGDYVKVDARARVEINKLDLDLYVRNLTNEDAFAFRGSYGAARGLNGDYFGYRMRPRTIGMQLSYDF